MSITQSPYYRSGQNVLPSGDSVKPGGFYIADDAGTAVFQLYSTTALPATKSDYTYDQPALFNINLNVQNPANTKIAGFAHPHPSGPFEAAPSLVMIYATVDHQVSDSLKIDPNAVDKTLSLNINGETGYFYTVPQRGAQLLFKHEGYYPRIVTHRMELDTRASGEIYFQFQNKAYLCKFYGEVTEFTVKLTNLQEAQHFAGAHWTPVYEPDSR